MEVDRRTGTNESGSSNSNVGVQEQSSHAGRSSPRIPLSSSNSTSSKMKPTRLSHPLMKVPVNGYTVSKLDKPKYSQNRNISNGRLSTIGDNKTPTINGLKRKIVFLEEEEDEDQGTKVVKVNGFAGGKLPTNGHHRPARLTSMISNKKYAELQKQRKDLPIAKGKDALIEEIMRNDTVVLLGETGSGKTTQIPQYILESRLADKGMIAVTQPRRVAATSLAERVAQEQNVQLGHQVGYAVRFNEAWSVQQTKIKFVTDGMLARELQSDPLLSRYSVIVVDEAHERTLNTDVLIANLKGIQKKRNMHHTLPNGDASWKGKGKQKETLSPLKIVIMSATLDAEKFSRFYNNAKILYVQGRQHPVKIYHTLTSQTDFIDSAMRTFFQIHVDQPPGDVLIFLPGQEDIESLEKAIQLYARQLPAEQMRVITCPLYAALPQHQQSAAFRLPPSNTRKCILATNIAETSITIPGIKYVIDTGKCKEKKHVARATGSGMETLLTQDISKSSAMQRAGRAGREGQGFCFRLYTEADFNQLPLSSIPEIQRCSLTSSMLQLKCLGQDLDTLEFLDPPEPDAIVSALKTLYVLGAINEKRELTEIGREMNKFPLEPNYARVLIAARENGCCAEVIDIVSILSSSSKLFLDSSEQRDQIHEAHMKFKHTSGDHMSSLNAFRAYQDILSESGVGKGARKDWCRKNFLNERTLMEAIDIRDQLRKVFEKNGLDWKTSSGDNAEPVLKSFLKGLVQNTALRKPEGGYKQIMGLATVKIHPGSTMSDRKVEAIMYDELIFTGASYARGVSAIPPAIILEHPALSLRSSG